MKLEPTRVEHVYDLKDGSGYRFKVVAELVPGRGWSASVTMNTDGMLTAEDAVAFLASPAKWFLRQVESLTGGGK